MPLCQVLSSVNHGWEELVFSPFIDELKPRVCGTFTEGFPAKMQQLPDLGVCTAVANTQGRRQTAQTAWLQSLHTHWHLVGHNWPLNDSDSAMIHGFPFKSGSQAW